MRTRRAFTAIELLVVIGIIITLAAILFVGMKAIQNNSRRRATETALKNCQSMLAELDAKTRLGSGPPVWTWFDTSMLTASAGGANNLNYFTRPYVTGAGVVEPLDAPGNVKADADVAMRSASPAIVNTTVVMGLLAALPQNRTMMQNFPQDQVFLPDYIATTSIKSPGTDRFLGTSDDSTQTTQYVTGARVRYAPSPTSPVVVYRCITTPAGAVTTAPGSSDWAPDSAPATMMKDGWGNPIIFVPASGLNVLLLNGKSDYDPSDTSQHWIITSPEGRVSGNGGGAPFVTTIGRPFFASAGPDGDFSKGDDNVYSFEQ